jgi:transglutaminase-like putative cysteine protease
MDTRMKTTEQSLTRKQHIMVSLFSALAILPHGLNLPIPVSTFLMLLFSWRFGSLYYPRLQPARWLLVLVTFASIFLVLNQFHTLIGRDAGVGLLAVMMMLKTLESHKRQDLYITVFISYFVIITHFLFDQSIPMALYLFVVMVCLTALLIEINRVGITTQKYQSLVRTGIITLQAIPIAIILFVIFPRMTHPLWNLGIGTSGKTGLSDRVSPGQFSELVESPEVAFRVSFDRDPPDPQNRYWRGLVVWDTDGVSWFNKPDKPTHRIKLKDFGNISYEVFLEAHQQKWLYGLDLPLRTDANFTSLTYDLLLLRDHPVKQSLQYRVWSTTEKKNRILPPIMRVRALDLPNNVTQRQFALVEKWRTKAKKPRDFVNLALAHFNQLPFVYTFSPPRYLDNPIDQFLFEGREGFCEHYATSFAQLMRIAGIPTRLVLGYQGGEYNEMGDYFIIRQYDAHAWTEVWLDETGWLRVDPTAAVAPERIRFPIRHEFGEEGSPVMFQLDSTGFVATSLRRFTHFLDNANVQWRRWVIGYSREHQFSLMRNFGFDQLSRIQWSLITITLISIPLLLVALRLILSGKNSPSPVMLAYNRFCKRLARLGIARYPHEGPMDFAQRAINHRPDLTSQISRITALYIKLRYGSNPDPSQAQVLIRQVRQFHPGRKKSTTSTV